MSLYEIYQHAVINSPVSQKDSKLIRCDEEIRKWIANVRDMLLSNPNYNEKLEEIKQNILQSQKDGNSVRPEFPLFKYYVTDNVTSSTNVPLPIDFVTMYYTLKEEDDECDNNFEIKIDAPGHLLDKSILYLHTNESCGQYEISLMLNVSGHISNSVCILF